MTDYIVYKSSRHPRKRPVLSVLIPYYKDDPSGLLHALLGQCDARKDVEIILYDDGTGDAVLTQNLRHSVEAAKSPVTLIEAQSNHGRSAARNALQDAARADWVLFLDADMRPTRNDFIENYLRLITADIADIIFGGFTVEARTDDPDTELHRFFSEVSDCHPLHIREQAGSQYVATSNLCVRKSVLETETFDARFKGWGWEDSEWAARVSQRYVLRHADNPALHLGMEKTDTLLQRFQNSGDNYALFTQIHPEFAKGLTLYRVSQKLKNLPGQKLMRPVLKFIVRFQGLPLHVRVTALKLWRASWYAESVS